MRVLDLFFFLRGKILFAIGLAIFKTFEQPILNCNDPDELMILLKDLSPLIHDPDLPLSLFKVLIFILLINIYNIELKIIIYIH